MISLEERITSAYLDGYDDGKDEYKWHDLRENPDYLPEEGALILVYSPYILRSYCVKRYSKYVNLSEYAVAWMYIDEFERED